MHNKSLIEKRLHTTHSMEEYRSLTQSRRKCGRPQLVVVIAAVTCNHLNPRSIHRQAGGVLKGHMVFPTHHLVRRQACMA